MSAEAARSARSRGARPEATPPLPTKEQLKTTVLNELSTRNDPTTEGKKVVENAEKTIADLKRFMEAA